MLIATASAKIILVGEHAVVYGKPAIAVPFSSLRVSVTSTSHANFQIIAENLENRVITLSDTENPLIRFAIQFSQITGVPLPHVSLGVKSDIPIASGLGSGASISTALGRALNKLMNTNISNEQLNKLVYESEKHYHGTPSGIDNTVIVYESPIRFQREHPIEIIRQFEPFYLVVADTGIFAPTHESVSSVRTLYNQFPQQTQVLFDEIESIVESAYQAILQGQIQKLGQLMNANHQILQQLTVSCNELDYLVQTALSQGALGAKLSGGGRGGNMIALTTLDQAFHIQQSLIQSGAVHAYITQVNP